MHVYKHYMYIYSISAKLSVIYQFQEEQWIYYKYTIQLYRATT